MRWACAVCVTVLHATVFWRWWRRGEAGAALTNWRVMEEVETVVLEVETVMKKRTGTMGMIGMMGYGGVWFGLVGMVGYGSGMVGMVGYGSGMVGMVGYDVVWVGYGVVWWVWVGYGVVWVEHGSGMGVVWYCVGWGSSGV